jgi:hypothetical protein
MSAVIIFIANTYLNDFLKICCLYFFNTRSFCNQELPQNVHIFKTENLCNREVIFTSYTQNSFVCCYIETLVKNAIVLIRVHLNGFAVEEISSG